MKRAPMLPTRATVGGKEPRLTPTELEDISHLETFDSFADFAGQHNPNMNDYFG